MNVVEKFTIDGDYIIRETVQNIKDDISTVRRDIVMDKATFKECYKKWILEDEEAILMGTLKVAETLEQEPTNAITLKGICECANPEQDAGSKR